MSYPHQQPTQAEAQIRPEHVLRAATLLRVKPVEIQAVFNVEASGKAFDKNGVLIQRFEPHHFPRRHWSQIGFVPGKLAPWRASLKIKTSARNVMFLKACAIDLEAAYDATSWGAGQIMGFNAKHAGYDSATEMVEEHVAKGAEEAVMAFARLIQSWKLDTHIRAHNWLGFATPYNGSGQAPVYAKKIEKEYRRLSGKASNVTLKFGDRGDSVIELQKGLAHHGMLNAVEVDGDFGPKTDAAVKRFQRMNGLVVDGVVGERTWNSLRVWSAAKIDNSLVEKQPVPEPVAEMVAEIGAPLGTAIGAGLTSMLSNLSPLAEGMLVGGAVVAGLAFVGVYVKRQWNKP